MIVFLYYRKAKRTSDEALVRALHYHFRKLSAVIQEEVLAFFKTKSFLTRCKY